MSVPDDPSRETIILGGMREAGQYTVTASSQAYLDFLAYQWDTLKTEIWNACRTDKFLEVETCLVCSPGLSALTLPADFDTEISLILHDANPGYRGTAQAGSSTTLTLAADFTEDPHAMLGRYLFTIAGTGAGQHRQITGYDNGTKLTTVPAWTVTPDNTTQYLVSQYTYELARRDYVPPQYPSSRPRFYSRLGIGLSVVPAGDQIYPIVLTYRSNLTRLDDTASPVFIKHLRERRLLWIEGVKTKTMARYDDDRFQAQKVIWENFLKQYGAQNPVYAQMQGHR